MFDAALLLRVKSGPLYRFRKHAHLTQKQAAELSGVALHKWQAAENLQFDRLRPEQLAAIALCAGVEVDDICAPNLRDRNLNNVFERARVILNPVSLQRLPQRTLSRLTYTPEKDPLDDVDRSERIDRVLESLTYREREIIKLRYGIGDGYTYTLEEVGKIFKMTRERVRMIEAKAIHKLQHPVRLTALGLENVFPEKSIAEVVAEEARHSSQQSPNNRQVGIKSSPAL